MMRLTAVAVLASLARLSQAQLSSFTPSSDSSLTYSVNVPDLTSSSGSGPIYIQIKGPTSKQWIALGQGTRMAGANIFVIYADGSGNVTISPRSGQGNFEPQFNSDAQIELLDGSGIVGDEMIANIRCENCLSWSGGEMEVTDTRSNWIWSVKNGSPLNHPDQSAGINQHDTYGTFTFDLTRATGGSSSNPFVQSSSPSSTSTATGSTPTSSNGDDDEPNSDDDDTGYDDNQGVGSGSGSGASEGASFTDLPRMLKIHGILMGIAFAVLFPLGAISIRVLPPGARVNVHMLVQMVAFALAIAGMAYGIMLGKDLKYLTETHPLIGMVVMGGLFFQPILGLIHHWLYRVKGKRTILAYLHTYWGRALVLLGIVNGGLGLELASNSRNGEIAYAVVAGVLGGLWILAAIMYYIRGGFKQNTAPAKYKNGVSNGEYNNVELQNQSVYR
ncbi:hypothetical protein ABW19_dt0207261 [Dactylella cylindrospora]|nr:hypothetical protein ABW19_dt0207261 [Dactylella cylindrospora]